jgi:hypothetical protein
MSGLDDDDLRAMLEARASGGAINPAEVLAEGRRRALATSPVGARRSGFRGVYAGLGGLAAITALVVLLVAPLTFRPAAVPTPSIHDPSIAPSAKTREAAQTPPPAGVAVTAAELDPAMGDTTGFVGLTIAFQGDLVTDPTPCPSGAVCGLRVDGLRRPHTLVAAAGQDLPALPASGRTTGTFAIRFTERTLDDGRMVFEDVGPLVPADGGRLVWPLPTLAADGGELPTGLIAATGRIVQINNRPCMTDPCTPSLDVLTVEVPQPPPADGSVPRPRVDSSIILTPGSLGEWASLPGADPQRDATRPVTLLLRLVKEAPWARTWQVAGRLDPPPFVDPVPPPDPAPLPTPKESTAPLPPPPAERLPGGFPTAIGGEPVFLGIDAMARLAAATDDTPFLVGGWFDGHALPACSPPVGQAGLDPLEARTCGSRVTGIPGEPLYRDGFEMPDGAGPIVLRMHTRDPGAAACTPVGRARCLERSVADAVVWFGDTGTMAAPINPVQARSMATSVFVMEWRNGSTAAVDEDVFTVPIACPAPWPTLLFSIHGDPRYGLVAVFPDANAREQFQAETDPELGAKCLDLPIERPAAARWVGHENMLVLLFADDVFATRLADVLVDPTLQQKALPMTEPAFDRTLGTVTDYLAARAAGELEHGWGARLGDGDVNGYVPWVADVMRRRAADALAGRAAVLDEMPTEARIGSRLWRLLDRAAVARSRIVRVTYDHATDPALATEEFLVLHTPESDFRDWMLIRIAGEPYPG